MQNRHVNKTAHFTALAVLALSGLPAREAHGLSGNDLNMVVSHFFPRGNLLENGAFEGNYTDYEFEAWGEGRTADSVAYAPLLITDTCTPKSGRRLAGIHYTAPVAAATPARFLLSDQFPLKPNKWYTFFLHYRNTGYDPANGSVYASFQAFKDRADTDPSSNVPFPIAAHASGPTYAATPFPEQWTLYTHRFFTGDSAHFGNLALLSSHAAGTNANFFFDDAYLAEGCVAVSLADFNSSATPAECKEVPFGEDRRHPDFIGISWKFTNGRSKVAQTVIQDGPRDLVSQTLYDHLGRVTRTTLPIANVFGEGHRYVSGITTLNDANDTLSHYYKPTHSPAPLLDEPILGKPARKYPDAGGTAYSEVRYENSPLGREVEAAGTGSDWNMNSTHTSRTAYGSVTSLDAADDPILTTAANNTGEFFFKEDTSVEGQVTREFTDRSGHVVRRSTKLHDGAQIRWPITDIKYDAAGNEKEIWAPAGAGGKKLRYIKGYDALNRVIADVTDATDTTRLMYDDLGRVRFTRSANQKLTNRFSFMRYDELGRILYSGEVLDATLFTPANANFPEFPCVQNCLNPGQSVASNLVKYRTVNIYDQEDAQITCQGTVIGNPQPGAGTVAFLAKSPAGVAVAAGFDLLDVYLEALSVLQGQSGEAKVLALYSPSGSAIAIPNIGSEFNFHVGALDITFEGISTDTPEGLQALALFQSLNSSKVKEFLAQDDFLKGRLVKTLSCNYELAEALAEMGPREVSKTFRYDRYGNVLGVMEINRYTENFSKQMQLVLHTYDIANRLLSKTVCGNSSCNEALNHVENYRYDQLGRISQVLDKANNPIVNNHYNFLGQLSAYVLGGTLSTPTLSKALSVQRAYHLNGWMEMDSVKQLRDGALVYAESLFYENGSTPRFDGNITEAVHSYGSAIGSSTQLAYAYVYDDMNRLRQSNVLPASANASSAYTYLDDGRINSMTRAGITGTYEYHGETGRLVRIEGDLVAGRLLDKDTVFLYDANGNMEVDSSKWQTNHPMNVFYRDDNRPYLVTYRPAGSSTDYQIYMAYDSEGNRVLKRTEANDQFLTSKTYFSMGKEIREGYQIAPVEFYTLSGGGRVKYNANKPNGEKEFYLLDHLGTTRASYSLERGEIDFAAHYFPYGKQFGGIKGVDDVTEKFTGKEHDDGLELDYFGARFYDPELGVWISPDAAREFASPYSYSPNPINAVDPDGNLTLEGMFRWAFNYSGSNEVDVSVPVSVEGPRVKNNEAKGQIKLQLLKIQGPKTIEFVVGESENAVTARQSALLSGDISFSLGRNGVRGAAYLKLTSTKTTTYSNTGFYDAAEINTGAGLELKMGSSRKFSAAALGGFGFESGFGVPEDD
jgi:RHS repeat-associated protein